jgi:hypothetical protein
MSRFTTAVRQPEPIEEKRPRAYLAEFLGTEMSAIPAQTARRGESVQQQPPVAAG